MWDGISDTGDPDAHEVAQALIRDPAAIPCLVELRQRAADLDDDALIAAAFEDPAFVSALIELSRTNELAMKAVRWALAYHVARWHRLTHGDAPS